jgi:hypothetical protein
LARDAVPRGDDESPSKRQSGSLRYQKTRGGEFPVEISGRAAADEMYGAEYRAKSVKISFGGIQYPMGQRHLP